MDSNPVLHRYVADHQHRVERIAVDASMANGGVTIRLDPVPVGATGH